MAPGSQVWSVRQSPALMQSWVQEPPSEGWTGAEVHNACQMHWELGLPLKETGQFIVPVVKSGAEQIKALRAQADRTFLSASKPGVYMKPSEVRERPTRRVAG